jgi:HEPN domain-containing protein
VNRTQWQKVAKERLKDAKALLGRKRWAAAYYMSGYVVECGLKSCLLRHLGESDAVFGDEKYLKELTRCWTHDLVSLVGLAGLTVDFGAACGANPALNDNWNLVKGWKETSRYVETRPEAEARAMFEAVSHNPDGVEYAISNGRTLLGRLRNDGVVVRVACWVKPNEEGRWTLYIATPSFDEKGTVEAYRQLTPALRSLGNDWITSSDVTLVGEKDPLVRDALDLLRRFPHTTPIQSPLSRLGGNPAHEVYVYPPGEVEVTLYHVVFPGAPADVFGGLSLDPLVLNGRFSVEVETPGDREEYRGKSGISCVVAAPQGATLERDETGRMVLAWDMNGKPRHSDANEVWSFAKLKLQGFRLLRDSERTRTSA